ncbi:hypothetical protein RB979_001716 [Vibrio alginolyticus]|nr:hypothetical protein [Vibrio alginolyticus]
MIKGTINAEFKRALFQSVLISALITAFLYFSQGVVTIDLASMLRVGVTLISAVVVGFFLKDFYELKKSISSFKLDEGAPEKVKSSLRETISVFSDNYINIKQFFTFGICFAVLMFMCYANFNVDSKALGFILKHFFVVLFAVYAVYFSLFINKLNNVLRKFSTWLDSQKDKEERRKELIEKIQKSRQEYEKSRNMSARNASFDIRELIEDKKKDANAEE